MLILEQGLQPVPTTAGIPEGVLAEYIKERDTAFGRLRHLGPVLQYSETPSRWDLPPVPLGAHPPRWPDALPTGNHKELLKADKAFNNPKHNAKSKRKKPIALILQGGGALGAHEWGAVTRLCEKDYQPVAVTGVSIGAVNAAAIAGARDNDIAGSLKRLWQKLTICDLTLPPSPSG